MFETYADATTSNPLDSIAAAGQTDRGAAASISEGGCRSCRSTMWLESWSTLAVGRCRVAGIPSMSMLKTPIQVQGKRSKAPLSWTAHTGHDRRVVREGVDGPALWEQVPLPREDRPHAVPGQRGLEGLGQVAAWGPCAVLSVCCIPASKSVARVGVLIGQGEEFPVRWCQRMGRGIMLAGELATRHIDLRPGRGRAVPAPARRSAAAAASGGGYADSASCSVSCSASGSVPQCPRGSSSTVPLAQGPAASSCCAYY